MSARAERRLRVATGVVGAAGLAVATYLLAVRWAGEDPACAITTGCAQVQSSEYAEVGGVPVALLGALAYVAILAFALRGGEVGRIGGLFTALVGVGFSAWLTYLEVGVIDAICVWCVVSAALMAIALALSIARLLASAAPA